MNFDVALNEDLSAAMIKGRPWYYNAHNSSEILAISKQGFIKKDVGFINSGICFSLFPTESSCVKTRISCDNVLQCTTRNFDKLFFELTGQKRTGKKGEDELLQACGYDGIYFKDDGWLIIFDKKKAKPLQMIFGEKLQPYKKKYKEEITLPIESGDSFLYGKFKNKRAIYKNHFINDKGDLIIVTDTGKEIPACKIRVLSENLQLKDFKKHSGASDFTRDWIEVRRKIKGAGNVSSKIKSIRVNRKKDYITFVFSSVPTYESPVLATNKSDMEITKKVNNYTQEIRVLDFFKWAETKPGFSEKNMSTQEIKEILDVADIKIYCNCPAFWWQGVSYYLTQLEGAIYPNNIQPQFWNKFHDRGNDIGLVCKHTSMILNSIDFWLNPMTSMVNKYLKKGAK